MDDLTLRYFDAEMRYLREAGKAFAQAHPDRAAMLDLDKAGTPDPCVERLFEGFACREMMSGSALTDGFHPVVLQKKIGCGRKVTVLSVGISYCWNISPYETGACLYHFEYWFVW